MLRYAKFDQNIPCGSNVLSILPTANGQIDRQMDGRTHTVVIVHKYRFAYQCLEMFKCISMHNLINTCHAVQE